MNSPEQVVHVTLKLPKEIYERVAHTAAGEQQPLEDLLNVLVAEGLDAHASVRELFERVSAQYRDRLAREGKLNQSADEVLQELRAMREQIAGELYPS
jgi:hypothetical protein